VQCLFPLEQVRGHLSVGLGRQLKANYHHIHQGSYLGDYIDGASSIDEKGNRRRKKEWINQREEERSNIGFQ